MPLFYCSHCGQHIDADDSLAGASVACPSCSGTIIVPDGTAAVPAPTTSKNPADTTHSQKTESRLVSVLGSRPTKASGIAFLVGFADVLTRPKSPLEQLGIHHRGIVSSLAESLGFLIGASLIALVISLLIAGVMSAFKRPFAASLARVYAVTVVVCALLSVYGSYIGRTSLAVQQGGTAPSRDEVKSAQEVISGLESDIKSLAAESVGPDGLPRTTALRFDSKTPASNDMERMRELTQEFLNDMISLQNEYLAALDLAGIDKLLVPQRVADDIGFRDSYAILAKARRTVQDFRGRVDELLLDYPKKFERSAMSPDAKKSMRSGFQQGLEKSTPLIKETWDIEVASVDRMGDLIELLESRRKFWTPLNGQFTFQLDGDLQRFNAILEQINDGVKRQTEIRQKSLQGATRTISDLKLKAPK